MLSEAMGAARPRPFFADAVPRRRAWSRQTTEHVARCAIARIPSRHASNDGDVLSGEWERDHLPVGELSGRYLGHYTGRFKHYAGLATGLAFAAALLTWRWARREALGLTRFTPQEAAISPAPL